MDAEVENLKEDLAFEIADEHMPMNSDEDNEKFNKEYAKALKYMVELLQDEITRYEE